MIYHTSMQRRTCVRSLTVTRSVCTAIANSYTRLVLHFPEAPNRLLASVFHDAF
jgi:hypothetical protein